MNVEECLHLTLLGKLIDDTEDNIVILLRTLSALYNCRDSNGSAPLKMHEKVFKTIDFKDASEGFVRASRSIPDHELALSLSSSSSLSSFAPFSSLTPSPSLTSFASLSPSPSLSFASSPHSSSTLSSLPWALHYYHQEPSKTGVLVRRVREITAGSLAAPFMQFMGYELDYEYILAGRVFSATPERPVETRVGQIYSLRREGEVSSMVRNKRLPGCVVELKSRVATDSLATADSCLQSLAAQLKSQVKFSKV